MKCRNTAAENGFLFLQYIYLFPSEGKCETSYSMSYEQSMPGTRKFGQYRKVKRAKRDLLIFGVFGDRTLSPLLLLQFHAYIRQATIENKSWICERNKMLNQRCFTNAYIWKQVSVIIPLSRIESQLVWFPCVNKTILSLHMVPLSLTLSLPSRPFRFRAQDT